MGVSHRWLWLGLLVPLLIWGCPPPYTGDDDDDDNDNDDTGDDDTGDDDTGDDDTGGNEYGPPNAWWHAQADDVPPNLTGEGYGNGDIAHNFVLTDQNGDQVELYQFFGQVIVIDVFAFW